MLLHSLTKASVMDKISKVLISVGLPVMVIGLVLMFNILKIEETIFTWCGVVLTLGGASLAWIGYARAKGLVT